MSKSSISFCGCQQFPSWMLGHKKDIWCNCVVFVCVHDMSASILPGPRYTGSKEQSMSHSHFLSPHVPPALRSLWLLSDEARSGSLCSLIPSIKSNLWTLHILLRNGNTLIHLTRPPGCRVRHARPPGALRARSWCQLAVSDAAARSQDTDTERNQTMFIREQWALCDSVATNQYRIRCNPADNSPML